MMHEVKEEALLEVLSTVNDPEIPFISIVDLGMVGEVTLSRDEISVSLMPTFIGCPAQQVIQSDVYNRITAAWPEYTVRVVFELHEPWSTQRITDRGREALKSHGIAPPGADLQDVSCPLCGEANAILENMFGATSCRSLYYCTHCRNPFEAFKPL